MFLDDVYRMLSDSDGLFTFLDMYLYGMVQIAWIAVSVWIVASLVRYKEQKLCWDCFDGERCKVEDTARLCSVKLCQKWCGQPWSKHKYLYRVAGVMLCLFATYNFYDVAGIVKQFWNTKVDYAFILQTLPSRLFDYLLLVLATLIYGYSFFVIVREVRYLKWFIVKMNKMKAGM